MTKQPLNINLRTLLFSGILSVATFSYWASVKAQVQTKLEQTTLPKYISAKDAGQLKLQSKPFIPKGLDESITPNEGVPRGIPGEIDHRTPMLSRKYPWSTIGRVQGTTSDAKNYHCTGVLIAENLVLTNAHCVIDPDTGKLSQQILFLPNVINRQVQDVKDIASVVEVIYGTDFKNGRQLNPNDWAVMKINKPLGSKYGYLGTKSLPTSKLISNKKNYFFVGYSRDFPTAKYQQYFSAGSGWTASFQKGCSIVKEEKNFLLHDCDTAAGSSGAPIIAMIDNKPYIIALNEAEVKDLINVAVKIDFLERLTSKN